MRVLLVLVFIFTLIQADRDGGPYIGFGYGFSKYDDDGKYEQILTDEAKIFTYYGGAYINKYLSVELGYAKIIGERYEVLDNSSEVNINYTLYNISALVHYSFFDDRLDFYAKFGTGYVRYLGEQGFSYVYGAGASVRFTKLLSLKVAYDTYQFGYDENSDNSAEYKMLIKYPYVALEFQF
jgi:opacity protein-like surface antigen